MKGTPQHVDDGAYDHLCAGMVIPALRLPATSGEPLDVVASHPFTVLFLYPMTGVPGEPLPEGWLELPGAFGCTAESCAYRDLIEEFALAGAAVHGVSTQTPQEQLEFAAREHITYPLLSDSEQLLVDALSLPLFQAGDLPPRIKRATLIVDRRRVLREVIYPVPDPAANAQQALAAVQRLAAG
jgi:peroxiredoxin